MGIKEDVFKRDNNECQLMKTMGVQWAGPCSDELVLWKRTSRPVEDSTSDDYITVCARCAGMLHRMVGGEKKQAEILNRPIRTASDLTGEDNRAPKEFIKDAENEENNESK